MFGQRISQLRKKRRLTQEQLAAILSITVGQVSRWERGENDPSIQSLTEVATKLNVTTDYLLGLVAKPEDRKSEEDLPQAERELLWLIRAGREAEAMRVLLGLTKSGDKGS